MAGKRTTLCQPNGLQASGDDHSCPFDCWKSSATIHRACAGFCNKPSDLPKTRQICPAQFVKGPGIQPDRFRGIRQWTFPGQTKESALQPDCLWDEALSSDDSASHCRCAW